MPCLLGERPLVTQNTHNKNRVVKKITTTDRKCSILAHIGWGLVVSFSTPKDQMIVPILSKILYKACTVFHPVQHKKRKHIITFIWSAELLHYMTNSKRVYVRWKVHRRMLISCKPMSLTKKVSTNVSAFSANIHNQLSLLISTLRCLIALCSYYQLTSEPITSLTWPDLNRTPSLTNTKRTLETWRGSLFSVSSGTVHQPVVTSRSISTISRTRKPMMPL